MNKIEQTQALLEKLTGRTVTLTEKKDNADALHIARERKLAKEKKAEEAAEKEEKEGTSKDKKKADKKVVAEAKDEKEKETPKEKKVDKAVEKAGDAAPANVEKTAAGIIPPSAIQTIQAFMDETLNDINEGVAELQAMRIDANTIASGDDYYSKAQELQDSIKQIARMSTFVKNSIIAKKFDANLLDMIVSYKHSHATPAVSAPAVEAPITPEVPMEAPVMESTKKVGKYNYFKA